MEKEKNNLELIINSMPVGIIILDENLKIKDVNKAFLNMFNRTYKESINKNPGDCIGCVNSFISPEGCGHSEPCENCDFRQKLKETVVNWILNEEFEVEYIILKDNRFQNVWFKITIIPLVRDGKKQVMIVIMDITEYKKLQSEIMYMNNFYHSIIEAFPDMLWRIDNNKKYSYFNKNWEKFTRESTKKFIKENFIIGIHPDDIEMFKMALDEAFNNKTHFSIRYRLKRFDGVYRLIVSRGNPIFDNDHKLSGYVGVDIDITDTQSASDELIRLKEAAEIANKAKSQFLANMSHEIRTPLNGIVGMIDLTISTKLTEEQKENLSIIKNCADTLLNLINDILDLSKIEAEKVIIEDIPFGINTLIKKVINTNLARANDENIELLYNIDKEVPQVLIGDSNKLQQILNNLVSNAVKFTQKGRVTLKINKLNNLNETFEIKFVVEDTGIGISEDEMKFLFKKFSQVDGSITRKYGGTGLGLAISKKLVELMGGTLNVTSKKNIGSKFYFNIKLKKAENIENKSNVSKDIIKGSRKSSILLVEDDDINQRVIKHMLKKIGYYNVETAKNGFEALKLNDNKKFDIILMDIQMPQLDGIETAQIIREKEKKLGTHIPIVATTAYALKGDKEKFLSKGMDYYIAKPLDMEELIKVLNRIENMLENEDRDIILDYLKYSGLKNNNDIKEIDEEMKLYLFDTLNELEFYLNLENQTTKTYYNIEVIAHDIKTKSDEKGLNFIKNLAFKIELAARKKDNISIQNNYEKIYNITIK